MQKRLIALSCLTLLSTAPASAGMFDDDEARKQIADIRQLHSQRIGELAEQMKQLDARTSQRLVDMVGQFEALNKQIAELRGQLEVINFNLDGLQKRQKDLYVDLDQRLRKQEEAKVAAVQQADADANTAAKQEAEASTAYDAAYALYQANKLKPAAEAFASLIKAYPNSKTIADAYFWLGLARAQTGDSYGAMVSLRKLVEAFPTSPKAADAMGAVASLQLEKGDKKGAKKTYLDLLSAYPDSEASKEAIKQLKKL